MTVLFFSPPTVGNEIPLTVQSQPTAEQPTSDKADRGCRQALLSKNTGADVTDAEREAEILEAGECIARFLKLGWTAEAHAARSLMYALINGRSAEQVRRMEVRRGLI